VADDGAPFPQSDVIPALETDAGAMVRDLVAAVRAMPEGDHVDLYDACAGKPESGRPWMAVVIVEAGERRWLMAAPTARDVAARLAQDRTLEWAFGDRGQLADLFLIAADAAEALASGAIPSAPELHS
jgi:hypothetical protein